MNRTLVFTALVAVAGLGLHSVQAQVSPRGPGQFSAAQITSQVEAAGYSQVRDIEFEDGFWEVKAVDAQGNRAKLLVDPDTGELIDARAPAAMTVADIGNLLQQQGYTRVRDIELDDGRYEAEAVNPAGHEVDLVLDPRDGRIIEEDIDD